MTFTKIMDPKELASFFGPDFQILHVQLDTDHDELKIRHNELTLLLYRGDKGNLSWTIENDKLGPIVGPESESRADSHELPPTQLPCQVTPVNRDDGV